MLVPQSRERTNTRTKTDSVYTVSHNSIGRHIIYTDRPWREDSQRWYLCRNCMCCGTPSAFWRRRARTDRFLSSLTPCKEQPAHTHTHCILIAVCCEQRTSVPSRFLVFAAIVSAHQRLVYNSVLVCARVRAGGRTKDVCVRVGFRCVWLIS